MDNLIIEGNLCFDFSGCSLLYAPIKFDKKNPGGMTGVDFIAETSDCLYFIEVKDFQNPSASDKQKTADYQMLIAAAKEKKSRSATQIEDKLSYEMGRNFCLGIGLKIKDSLLRKYAMGEAISKSVVYIFVLNMDNLGENERGFLKSKINNGYIPTGLNADEFSNFSEINFDLVNARQLKSYGIVCSAIS